jgi:hypothetical protein
MDSELPDKRVVRRILRSKRGEVKGRLKKMHIKASLNLSCSPFMIETMKLRKNTTAGHVE